jgi:general secretion pathway protein B
MSYILDALKKSDLQRKQGDVPTLQTVHLPVRPQDKTPRVLYGVIVLLLLLLMFVLGYLVSQQFLPSRNESVAVVLPPLDNAAESVKQNVSMQPGETGSQNTGSVQASGETGRAPDIQRQSSASEDSLSAKSAVQKNNTEKSAAVTALPENNQTAEPDLMNIPYLHELPDYQQQSIPAMEFAGHVYSSDASSRSVIINGRFMEQGDTLLPGLRIETITINGVVFAYQDSLFRIDILQDWSFE